MKDGSVVDGLVRFVLATRDLGNLVVYLLQITLATCAKSTSTEGKGKVAYC